MLKFGSGQGPFRRGERVRAQGPWSSQVRGFLGAFDGSVPGCGLP